MSSSNFLKYRGFLMVSKYYDIDTFEYVCNEFQVRDQDVFSITYPKSGSTWMQEILTLIQNDGDTTISQTVPIWERMPWLELSLAYKHLESLPSPRFITSHLPVHLFPKSFFTSKAKVIYTVRNPRDVLVSLHYFSKAAGFLDELENIEELLPKFLRGEVLGGSWFDHVRGWLGVKDQVNLLIVTYEELLQDLRGSVVRICNFLGKELNEAAIDSVVENTTLKSMKDNKMSNYSTLDKEIMDTQKSPFIRKGISGDWKNHFNPAMSETFDAAYKEAIKDINFKFVWDQSKAFPFENGFSSAASGGLFCITENTEERGNASRGTKGPVKWVRELEGRYCRQLRPGHWRGHFSFCVASVVLESGASARTLPSCQSLSMAKVSEQYFLHEGIPFPTIVHNEESLNFIRNEFQVHDDDVYNVTYPKSGTTWMQELLTLMNSKGNVTHSHSIPNWERVPWIEQVSAQKFLQNLAPPRIMTSHLPAQLFPKSFFKSKAKVIYTMRHPKDVCVSLYHYCLMAVFLENPQDFDTFLSSFLEGDVLMGSWFDHVQSWMRVKDRVNILFQTYEELLQDLRGSVVKMCNFLGWELDEAAIDSVVENANFETMKDNKMTNYSLVPSDILDPKKGSFFRKGISGDWKNHFTQAQSECFDQIYQEKMKDLEAIFTWDQP
uniref:Uncharacterized protein LOC117368666 n=1 Tax=Geotrypetes seraphini TaxID=260995 RepID=A0A6P8SII6_GEOSA|nr:uncharacterized protein LOC117368666 [Geotrypetes seraphini]